jgi:hypothetical protein
MFNIVAKEEIVANGEKEKGYPNYGRALISGLKKSRKGKHHELMGRIMEDLKKSAPNYAVRIPLSSMEGVSVLNLRSAIVRAAKKEGISVSTSSDDQNFYLWKAQ